MDIYPIAKCSKCGEEKRLYEFEYDKQKGKHAASKTPVCQICSSKLRNKGRVKIKSDWIYGVGL
jgi:DNA-directed RNA polymerase subunit RPC12/RpoP